MSDRRFAAFAIILCLFVMPPSIFFAAVCFNAFTGGVL